MTNVLILYETVEPCNIGAVKTLSMLEKQGVLFERHTIVSKVLNVDLKWSDVVVFVRSTSPLELNLCRLLVRMGKYVILLIDDDFLSLGDNYGIDGEGYRTKRKKALSGILNNVHLLWTCNENLAKKYCALGKVSKYVLSNTIIDKGELFSPRQKGKNEDRIRIVFYVNDGTLDMFNDVLKPVIPMLCERYSNMLSLYLIALHPKFEGHEGKMEIVYVPHMPYYEFKYFMGTEHFDIGLAPLLDSDFSKSKYFNKYIEYTNAGIPAIYSDCTLYRQVIVPEFNGKLCSNNPVSWFDAICDWIDHPEKRKKVITNAQKHIYENFSAEMLLAKLLVDIPQFSSYKTTSNNVRLLSIRVIFFKIGYFWFRISGWVNTTMVFVRRGDLAAFLKRLNNRIIKL